MSINKSVRIDQPCEQVWGDMEVVKEGRYCESCCKTVIDFTTMSNQAIIKYLSQSNHVCGRFGDEQLKQLNCSLISKQTSLFGWKKWGIAAILLGISPIVEAKSKAITPIEQSPFIKKHASTDDSTKVFKGRILDDEDSPIEGASIMVKGSNRPVVTNSQGEFGIKIKSNKDTLVAKFIGYEPREVQVKDLVKNDLVLNAQVQHYTATLGGAVFVVRPQYFYVRWWYNLKRNIRSIF